MFTVTDLIELIDAYKAAASVSEDKTVSYRVFKDSKKVSALRSGGDITVGRVVEAVSWMSSNWPENAPRPDILTTTNEKGAA